ncbi:peptidase M20 [Thermogymnomonas acidicola]|uniref:Peptidase M20 n=1 Tax=Thermogymnomonas acidicola TaxID=399579 RepID=A0AA37BQH1_9ARCH|nr:M20 family metallopeptidase [Thermogymnomonas acidicola]GGM67809.1 peptidase M20 [Thermogymnomonas acidicola]
MEGVREWMAGKREEMLSLLSTMVSMETPSTDKDLLDGFAEWLADTVERLTGISARIIRLGNSGNAVLCGDGKDLLLNHYDTVWPKGTIGKRPFRTDGRFAYGPGVFDMKAGMVQCLYAMQFAAEHGGSFVSLFTGDEEVGSTESRPIIEDLASRSSRVFVMEPSQDGKIKTSRKGVGDYTVTFRGRAAHAGLEPEKGVNAIDEMARAVLFLHSLSDTARGTTVSVNVASGGTRSNVIADWAQVQVDVRVWTLSEAERVDGQIRSMRPHNPGATIEVSGGINRPPMERTRATVELFEEARRAARTLGIDLQECAVGGGSDGNFCSAMGKPVLDGMGAVGSGAHAESEVVSVDEMPLRAALLAALISPP